MAGKSLEMIPKRLMCFRIPGGKPYVFLVPFPIGQYGLYFNFRQELFDRLRIASHVILVHPDYLVTDSFFETYGVVGVHAYLKSIEKIGKSIVLDLDLMRRVVIPHRLRPDSNRVYMAKWEVFSEKPLDREVFSSAEFQLQIERLRLLAAQSYIRNPVHLKDITIPPHKHSSETIARFIDEMAFRLNLHSDELFEELIAILSERDIEERLYKTIEAYDTFLTRRIEWEREELKLPIPPSISPSDLARRLLLSTSEPEEVAPVSSKEEFPNKMSDRAILAQILLINPTPKKGG